MIHKNTNAYKSIGEVAKILDLRNKKKGTLNTHTIRFWEKEFKQIKPKKINNNDILLKILVKDCCAVLRGSESRCPSFMLRDVWHVGSKMRAVRMKGVGCHILSGL